MTEKLIAYRSTHPDVLATLAKYHADVKQWQADAAELLKELGFTDRGFLVGRGLGQRWIAGVEYRDGDPVPTGWRLRKRRGRVEGLTPHRGTQAGRAIAAQIQACPVPDMPQAHLPGMPADRPSDEGLRSPGLREMAGAVYVTWTIDAIPEIPADGPEREEHLGDDEHWRTIRLVHHVDLAIWERVPLSQYYATVEAQDEAKAGEGQ
ncbi:hypothetical protein [Actinoallomurus sp. CA-142502]|uniref:hypothetical protein n=1 Tax=Actinoallomurus sp. CA-142502 TaxID=3239885 RepID=UPI003D9147C6